MPKRRTAQKLSRRTDPHLLYEMSVQDADCETRFLVRLFERLRGRKPTTLREDFCGTAALCASWARSRKDRRATGIDIDRKVLAWGKKHHLDPLGEAATRVRLVRQDVKRPLAGRWDILVAFNFSYWVFKERGAMVEYFRAARRALGPDGLFFIDAYGGWGAFEPFAESYPIRKGLRYIWDRAKVDPITHDVLNHIDFVFADGSELRRAFTYDWRLWTLPELRDILADAGFSRSTVYWEDGDAKGEGTGRFRPKEHAKPEASWIAYIISEP